jgi:hypothetical protein
MLQNFLNHWEPVAHACHPSYSGGRDQEDHSWKPARGNTSRDLILKKKNHKKRAGGVAQGVDPEVKPQYHKNKNLYKFIYLCIYLLYVIKIKAW